MPIGEGITARNSAANMQRAYDYCDDYWSC